MQQFLSILIFLVFIGCTSHPDNSTNLFVSKQTIAFVQKKIKTDSFFKQKWAVIKLIADETLADTSAIFLPLRGGNWPHYYVDPDEGKPLVPGRYLGNWRWEHHDQSGTKTYYGDTNVIKFDYDAVLINTRVHHDWANRLFALALAYRVTDNSDYLRGVEKIVAAYNKYYIKIPIHDKAGGADFNHGNGVGRIAAQALDESVWLCDVLQALGLVWDSMSEECRLETKEKLLDPAVDIIQRSKPLGVHNITCWYNAAVGITGFLTKNDSLIQWALFRPELGLKYQLEHGFTQSGHWYEMAPSYHFYALKPFLLLIETAQNNGNHEFTKYLQKTFEAPLLLTMPNMEIPRFNDSRRTLLPAYGSLYEYAYAQFGNEKFLPIISQSRQFDEKPEKQIFLYNPKTQSFDYSLLFGEVLPENLPEFRAEGTSYSDEGYDVLSKAGVWLAFKYDAHPDLGWHAHPDALSFVVYAKDIIITQDPGHAEYAAPIQNGWYKTSFAHNALIVNGNSQRILPTRHLVFSDSTAIPYAMAMTNSAYPGVCHYRAVAIFDSNTILIADKVIAESESELMLAYHQRGVYLNKPQGKAFRHKINEFQYLDQIEKTSLAYSHEFSTLIDNQSEVLVQIQTLQETSLITSIGKGADFEPTPANYLCAKGKILDVVWLISFDGKARKVIFEKRDDAFFITYKNQKFILNFPDI